jgi:cysteinyl-tRNA synthetase
MQSLGSQTVEHMTAALDDDLNTAQAQAAILKMVRQANATFDRSGIRQADVAPLLAALQKFDEIFVVLDDDDGPKLKRVFDWAIAAGRDQDISDELREAVQSGQLADAEIDKQIDAMKAARRDRDFKASDAIRAALADRGILVEITKESIRWRRK